MEAGREAGCRGAAVTVVHAYPHDAEADSAVTAAVREAAVATAAFGAALVRRHYLGLEIRGTAVVGPASEVLATAARCADLLALGVRGVGGFPGQTLGSVTLRTLARTPCPTLVACGAQREPRGLVLAALDIDDPAEEVLNAASAEARFRSAALRVVSALDLGEVRTALGDTDEAREVCAGILAEATLELDRLVSQRRDRCTTVRATGQVLDSPPTAGLTAATAQADLIVVGAHRVDGGQRGVRIGPIAYTLLRHAACPVVVVPHA